MAGLGRGAAAPRGGLLRKESSAGLPSAWDRGGSMGRRPGVGGGDEPGEEQGQEDAGGEARRERVTAVLRKGCGLPLVVLEHWAWG